MKNLTRFQYILKNTWPLVGFCLVLLTLLIRWAWTAEYNEAAAYLIGIAFIMLVIGYTIFHYYRKYDKL